MPVNPGLSIVLPVFNEGKGLDSRLAKLKQQLSDLPDQEIIVSDGGSEDDTVAIAQHHGCTVINGSRGRAKQLNRGAKHAAYDWLLFLHADTQLPDDFHTRLMRADAWGFFTLRLSGSHSAFRLVEKMINGRSSWSGISTGDQAQFFKTEFFQSIGGYPDIPLMEDVAISKQARSVSKPLVITDPVITSSRRWEENGIVKTILLMWWLRFAFWIGVSAKRLHRIYYPQHD